MATTKQRKAIAKTIERLGNNQPVIMGEVMLEAGYSKAMANNPQQLTTSKAWNETMKGIDWGKQLRQVEEMGDSELNEDKDNCLKAKDMLFKIGDKYPKGETKIIGIFNKIEAISDNSGNNNEQKGA
jgi:hypothetical protein